MMNIVTKTEVAYYDLILAREQIGVQEMALAQARQLLAEDQRRVQMGMLPPAGEQDAAAQAETAQANLLAAQLAFASQQNVLKGLIGDDFRRWADVRLDPSDALEAVATPLQRRECWDRALEQRPDIRQFRLELEKHNLQVRYRFNQLFPSLDVVGSVGGRAVDSTFGEAFDQLGDFSNPRYSYGIVLSYPLSNRAARSAYRAGETERTTAELRLKQLEQDILIQVDDAVNFVETAFRRVGATRQARTYAEAALAAERRKLANGESTSFIVLEMLNRLTASRGAESRALTDYHKALAQLAFAEGSSLERNRLDVKFK
jgi:outer membrane protein TolC